MKPSKPGGAASPPVYRHRCFCCVGKTMHESGPCVTCGARGFLLDLVEKLPDSDMVQHRHTIHTHPTCKLTDAERAASIAFIAAGEPNTYEPTVRYWEDHPEAPYATLLSVIETYCHPEAWEGAYDQLKALAQHTDDTEMTIFKRELAETIRDPAVLPPGALRVAAEYEDGSATAFLARLWRDLYPAGSGP